ncbi:MAG: beta-carotene 15,15'-dioxygenase, Brp/Blh family [Cyclobacteriaceae bacterium]
MHYHYIFSGFGASACILFHELHSRGLLANKHIAIIEPASKDINDRTFCFWAEPTSELVTRFKPIISHSWEQVEFNGMIQSIEPMRYYHIRGIDLYRFTRSLLEQYAIDWYQERILEIVRQDGKSICRTESTQLTGDSCFDSRTVARSAPVFPEVALIQSFFGLKVRLHHPVANVRHATLMDFEVPQDNQTQFLYRLPYNDREWLMELTRFGEVPIDESLARPQLEAYIREKFGDYDVLETETGGIPMVYSVDQPEVMEGIYRLGTRAGMVKPSTGYAFKNMFRHATATADALIKNSVSVQAAKSSARFRFYDHLLLIILYLWPDQGKRIFDHLLRSVPASRVLQFLDERSSIWQEAKIFIRLPIVLFLKALVVREWYSFKKHRTELMVLIGTSLTVLLGWFVPTLRDGVAWSILLVGLIVVGIPHGAIDDMLDSRGGVRKINLSFISLYLLQSTVMLLIWLLHAPTALIIFLLYSAWHFGQADLVESGLEVSDGRGRFNVMLQGAGTLSVILLSHIPDLNKILLELTITEISKEWGIVSLVVLALLFLNSLILGSRKLLLGCISLALTTQLPLLMAFGVFFIFQHSLRGWRHIRNQFQKSNVDLFVSALPFSLGAWLMMGLLYWILMTYSPTGTGFGLVGIFFVFLSALSFPHVVAMHGFYRKK